MGQDASRFEVFRSRKSPEPRYEDGGPLPKSLWRIVMIVLCVFFSLMYECGSCALDCFDHVTGKKERRMELERREKRHRDALEKYEQEQKDRAASMGSQVPATKP